MIVKDKESGELYESFLGAVMPYECMPTEAEELEFRRWLDAQDNNEAGND